jgi:hypothetical protein
LKFTEFWSSDRYNSFILKFSKTGVSRYRLGLTVILKGLLISQFDDVNSIDLSEDSWKKRTDNIFNEIIEDMPKFESYVQKYDDIILGYAKREGYDPQPSTIFHLRANVYNYIIKVKISKFPPKNDSEFKILVAEAFDDLKNRGKIEKNGY